MNLGLHDVRRAAAWSAPPFVAWISATLLTWWIAALCHVSYWSAAGRERWDSEHYLSISRSGYEMFRCWDRPGYKSAGFPDVICGNVAWFPGYPMVVRVFSATGLNYDAAAVVVAELSLLAMLLVLWYLIGARLTWASGLTLAIGTVFVGGIYYHLAFPTSLGTLGLILCVLAVKRGSWTLAAAAGFLASACHPVGAVAVGMLALSVLFAWKGDAWKVRVAKAGSSAAIAYGGVLYAKWMMWRDTGHWNAYAEINRSSYHQGGLRNPISEFDAARHFDFSRFFHQQPPVPWLLEHSQQANHAELWVNLGFVLVVVAATAWRLWDQRRLEVEEWASLLLLGGVFWTPFVAGAQMSWYRNHAQMFIGLVLVAKMPRALQLLILVVFVPMYVFLAAMFFGGSLV
jgi:hypothetical protein